MTIKFTKQRLRAYEVNYDVQTNVLRQKKQLIRKGNNFWRNHRLNKKHIWLKTKTSKKLNISFEEIEEFIILNRFKKKKSFQNIMERQLNYLIREQLHHINRSYPPKILSDKLADLIAKYLVCHAQDRRILHLSLIHIWRCRRRG